MFAIPRMIIKFTQPCIPRNYANDLRPMPTFSRIVQYRSSCQEIGLDSLNNCTHFCVPGRSLDSADPTVICSTASEVSKPPAVLYCSPEAINSSSWAVSGHHKTVVVRDSSRLQAVCTCVHASDTPPLGHCYEYQCVAISPVWSDKCLEKSLSGCLVA